MNKFLALVCILREENFTKQGLIDYNFQCFRQSIQDVFFHRINESRMSQNNSLILIETPYGSSSAQGVDDNVVVGHVNNNNEHDIDSYNNEIVIDKRSTTPIDSNNQYKSTSASSNRYHRKLAILPTTAIPSSLPNNNHQSNMHTPNKAKVHSANIFNNYTNNLEPRFV